MTTKAYSYLRFSTPEQASSDSERRQSALAQKYIDDNKNLGLTLDKKFSIKDLGISAYKGLNTEEGKLGAFIDAVKSGAIEKGAYLLVENLDRLSREDVHTAYNRFSALLELGIVIVTLTDGRKYEKGNMELVDMIISLTIMERSHEESKLKSLRISAAWNNKKANINRIKLTKWSPKWLNLSDDRKTFIVDQGRAKIIGQIFQWTIDGHGTSLIIQKLQKNNVEPWDMGSIKRTKRLAREWHGGIIHRFLTDRTVLGEYKLKHQNSNEVEIIKDYYPQIITNEVFYNALDARKSRRIHGGGRKGKTYSNLFSKLAYCGYSIDSNFSHHKCDGDNQKFVFTNKGQKPQNKYLQCARLKGGKSGCIYSRKMWRYDHFETSFLTYVTDIDASTLIGKPNNLKKEITLLKNTITVNEGKLSHLELQEINFSKTLDQITDIPKLLINKLIDIEAKKTDLQETINNDKSILSRKENTASKSRDINLELSHLIKVMKLSEDTDKLLELRLKLSNVLKEAIEKIEIYSAGKVHDENYFENLRSQGADDEIIRIMKSNDQQAPTLPFFIVKFKSNESRLVTTNPKDASKIISSIKIDKDGLFMPEESKTIIDS